MIFKMPKAIVNLLTKGGPAASGRVCKVAGASGVKTPLHCTPITWEALGRRYSPHCYVIPLNSFHRPLASHFIVDSRSFLKLPPSLAHPSRLLSSQFNANLNSGEWAAAAARRTQGADVRRNFYLPSRFLINSI